MNARGGCERVVFGRFDPSLGAHSTKQDLDERELEHLGVHPLHFLPKSCFLAVYVTLPTRLQRSYSPEDQRSVSVSLHEDGWTPDVPHAYSNSCTPVNIFNTHSSSGQGPALEFPTLMRSA